MNNRLNLNRTNADVQRAWVDSLSNAHTFFPMHTTPSGNKSRNYGIGADVKITIAGCKIRCFIAKEVYRVFAERTQADVQTQFEETFVDMLQLGNSAASEGVKTASIRFLEKIGMN